MNLKFIQLLFYVISRKDKLSLPARHASKLSIWGGGRGDIVKCHAMER